MAVTAALRAKFSAMQTGEIEGGSMSFNLAIDKAMNFADGTGAGQADILWSDQRTIEASSSEDLDLAGVLSTALGDVVEAAELVAVLVIADDANTNNVVLGDATQPIPLFGGTNPTFAVKPGGFFFVAAPNAAGLLTVGAGSTDDLKVANSGSGSSVTYSIAILARSA